MITAFFIYDAKGDVLMSKLYKDTVKRNICDVFRIQVITANSKTATSTRSPILTLGSTSFVYIRSGTLWMCVVSRSNQDCAVILEFLYNLERLLKTLLIGTDKPLTDDSVTSNFNLVYELLDEVVEYGYPTNMERNYLKHRLVSVAANDRIFKNPLAPAPKASSRPQQSAQLAITWRDEGIKYRRNEIFLNVDEKITVLMNEQAEVLRAYVSGAMNMKTHLLGMPTCRLGLSLDLAMASDQNPDVSLADSKFHQCVDLAKFDADRDIQFVPPDGEFQLMSYHCLHSINLPFKVYPQVQEVGRLRISYKIRIKSTFPAKISASDVVLKIPAPKGVLKSYATNSGGKSRFSSDENMFVWKFNKFFGDQEHFFTGEVELSQNDTLNQTSINWSRPPIKLGFMLEMFSSSGLTVKFLKVLEKSSYRTVKWVKYLTQAEGYDIRY